MSVSICSRSRERIGAGQWAAIHGSRKSLLFLAIVLGAAGILVVGWFVKVTLTSELIARGGPRFGRGQAFVGGEVVSEQEINGFTSGMARLPMEEKAVFQAEMLIPVGGYRVNSGSDVGGRAIKWSSGAIDVHPLNGHWVISHSKAVMECIEPGPMGRIGTPVTSWPLLKVERHQRMLGDEVKTESNRLTPAGVLWKDENVVLGSGRRGYRGKHNPSWAAAVNLTTGKETRYTLGSNEEDSQRYGYNAQLAFGSGFTRIPEEWASRFNEGGIIAMAAGGYDTLGCHFGPTLATWKLGEKFPRPLLEHFPREYAATRDSAYFYPNKIRGQLPIWRSPDGFNGYWQGSPVSHGAAWIDHPRVRGVVFTSTHGRGYIDYRSQGRTGNGPAAFTVADPLGFYTHRDYGAGRGGAGFEYWNADGPKGIGVRTLHIYDPVQLGEVAEGRRKATDCDQVNGDIPTQGLPISEKRRSTTKVSGLCWDTRRNLLWMSFRFMEGASYVLVAFRVDPDAVSKTGEDEPQLKLPDGWKLDESGKLTRIASLAMEHNGLKAENGKGKLLLSWTPSALKNHLDFQILRGESETGPYEVVKSVSETSASVDAPSSPTFYLVVDRVQKDKAIEVHDIRGKILVEP